MRFTIDKKTFESLFAPLWRLAAHSTMGLVKVELGEGGGSLRMTATDMMNTLRLEAGCEGEGKGEALVDARRFFPVLKELPEGPVTVTVGGSSLVIDWDCERGSCQFPVSPYDTFPPTPELGREAGSAIRRVAMSREDLQRIVQGVIPATDDKDMAYRPVLGGLYFDVDGGTLTVVGTDGQMLLARDVAMRTDGGEKYGFLIPKAAVATLEGVIPDDAGDVDLYCDGKAFMCGGDGYRLVTRCIEQRFPAYRSVIPDGEGGGRLTVDRLELMSAIRRVAAMTRSEPDKDTAVFDIRGGVTPTLTLMAQSLTDFSTVREAVECEWDGGDMRVGFRVQRLTTLLGSTKAARVTLSLTRPDRAVLFLPEDDEAARGMIMPAPVKEFVDLEKVRKVRSGAASRR